VNASDSRRGRPRPGRPPLARAGAGGPPDARTPITAALPTATGPRQALICLAAARTVYCALVHEDETVELDTAVADEILLAALEHDETGTAPDPAWLRTAELAARRAVRREIRIASGRGTTTDRPARHAARVLRRWLRSRPGGPTDAEAETADRLMRALRSCDTATAVRITELAAESLPDDDFVRGLRSIPALDDPPVRYVAPLPGVRLLAALDLVPPGVADRG
jgi:hypothetical protein